MTLRALIIDEEPEFRRLLAMHLEVGFESPSIRAVMPDDRARSLLERAATDFDVILLGDRTGAVEPEAWITGIDALETSPPLVFFGAEGKPGAREPGLVLWRLRRERFGHRALVTAVDAACRAWRERQAAEPDPTIGTEALDEDCRFGGLVIRGYRAITTLAERADSAVYLAEDRTTSRKVVLKVLREMRHEAEAGGPTFDRFLREYEIAHGLDHPEVVKIHDFGVADDYAYIVMEYFPDGDLRARIRAGLKPLQALGLARGIAQALAILHGAGVLHRDLKPGNVMFREEGTISLIDFGMARRSAPGLDVTLACEIAGTPAYMSPEQGHGRELDERSDLYSLGVILFEMLSGRKPYEADTPMQVVYRHGNDPIPSLGDGLQALDPLLSRCLAKEPDQRFPTASRLVEALRRAEEELSLAAPGGG
ncbi:MAG: protein kinase domain-containing protein [Steroidobacteraceae bacterium]